MSGSQLILVVDDDPHIREVVRFALQAAGFKTVSASDGKEALTVFHEQRPDLIILDILMPEMDGTEVCRAIRTKSQAPILFLTSRDDEVDRIVGLEIGGDDYVTKPFSPRELVARTRAILRRTSGENPDAAPETASPAGESTDQSHGRLRLDVNRFQAFWDEAEVTLTATEFGIVRTLLGFPGKVFTRDELMSGAYTSPTIVTDRTIDSHVRRVRRKFAEVGGDPIQTVHGVGYRLGPCR